jgi:PAS domain S-box-containing protein
MMENKNKIFNKIKEIKQAELALRESEALYRTLVEKMPDGVYKSTHDGKFVDVNPAMVKMLGYESKEELMDIDIKSQLYFEPDDRESLVLEEKQKEMGIYRLKKKDGSEIWVEDHSWYTSGENGEILFHEGILRDITDRRHEELERQVIYEISQSVAMTENLNELLESIHQSLGKVLYAENCYVALHDKNTGLFSFPYFEDQIDSIPGPLALLKSCTAYVFRTGKTVLINPEIFKQLEKQNEVKLIGVPSPSWIGVPLKTPDGTIGVLVLQHYEKENIYSEHDIQFLDSVGSQIAVAIVRRQAERDLRNERLLLRTVIDNIPDSIYCKDTAGRKTLVNLTELRFSRVNSETEIIGKTDFDLYPKELAEAFYADDQIVLQTGQPVLNREEFVLDNNGMKRWLLTSKIPMKDEVGNITGIIGIGRDITSRRQAAEELRESEIKLKVILQSTADGILAIDGNGKIIETNKRFAQLWHIPQKLIDSGDDDKLLNFVLDQLTNSEDFISKVKKLYHSTDVDLDHLFFRDGRVFERFSAPLNMPDASIGRVWSFRDITERMRTEAEIIHKNEELAGLNAEKDKFFSIIAHDLKGPFNGFLGLTQIMAEELPSLTATEVQNIAVSMRNSAKNLYHLLENLLEWAQIKKGAFPFNPEVIHLAAVVSSSIDMLHDSAKRKNIEIATDIAEGLLAFADMNMFQTIIRNLVLNAIKFTYKGGKVSILAKTTSDNFIEISVQDNGIGMSQTIIENLFRIDVQTNRTGTEGEPSTGLGLLLCKEFVEKHGCKIRVESEEANLPAGKTGGSSFYFTLPIFTAPESESNNSIEILNPEKKVQNNNLKILIAEDDETSGELISIHIRKFGKEIINVQNGREALEACRNNPDIDLILMDIQMPEMNGYEASRQIRQFNKKVIIIALTAFALAGDREKAIEAGCNDYIAKPINKSELMGLIQKYFKK